MRLFFLIVFIGLNSYSQKIFVNDGSVYQNSSLDTLKQEFHVFFKDLKLTVDLNNFEKRTTPLFLEKGLDQSQAYLDNTLIKTKETLYFVFGPGGMVYTIQNDTIKRIDNSFNHGMQYGIEPFEHNDTAFKYGGYGFWSDRDFFTYYDQQLNEWEVYHPIQSEIIPPGRRGYNYIKYQNLFHVFGGFRVNPNNRRENLQTNEVWTFDFNTDQWHFLGTHDALKNPLRSIPFKNKLALVERNDVIVIDVEENTKSVYKHSPISAQLDHFRYVAFAGGKFYVLMSNNTTMYLHIVDEADFFGELTERTPFYKNQTYWLKEGGIYALLFFLIILTLWLIKRGYDKRNKIKLLDNGLRYRLKFTEFDMESMTIIKLLLSKPHVASNQILKIVEKEQYSPAHNERLKVQKINDINIKIATLLGSSETIISNFKAANDRRIRVYTIRKDLFN